MLTSADATKDEVTLASSLFVGVVMISSLVTLSLALPFGSLAASLVPFTPCFTPLATVAIAATSPTHREVVGSLRSELCGCFEIDV